MKPSAGLLPLYLELYDDRLPEMRKVLDPFAAQVAEGLQQQGLDVLQTPVVRTRQEAEQALLLMEKGNIDAIVTLHLAYSPSLVSAELLARTSLPVILCDTTMDYSFDQSTDISRLLYNHGIHGVQDLASMLRRMGKHFEIAAGHLTESDVLQRTAQLVRAAAAAKSLRNTRALRVGNAFVGMGDFSVPEEQLSRVLGIKVHEIAPADLAAFATRFTDADIQTELARDRELYRVTAPEDVHRRSVRVSLALRECLEQGGYSAFSMNFGCFNSRQEPIDTVPFLEASKAMSRGIGYAGEGDVLTASLVGALARSFGDTTFTEIFCPDWKGNTLFLSHMGEINPALAAGKAVLCEKPYSLSDTNNPTILAAACRPGPAVLVNLTPGPNSSFDLLLAPVQVLEDSTHPSMQDQIRTWIRPGRPLAEFLETYSRHGGTHHSALVLNGNLEALKAFAAFVGFGCHVI